MERIRPSRLSLFILIMAIPLPLLGDYFGGEYRTLEAALYGRFTVSYRPAAGDGLVSSFFTYNDQYPSTPWCEIDLEILGRYDQVCQFNAITNGQLNHLRHHFLDFNPLLDFHEYSFEWTPEYVAWFVDGAEVYRQTGDHVALLNEPQKIMMNIWNPVYDNWVGDWNEAILPRFSWYDYVSYASWTPGTGTVGSGNNFTPIWIDNFDVWDTDRWDKASHSFPGNQCTFTPENVVFQDGYLILCLTDDQHLGLVDTEPPHVLWARASAESVMIHFSEELSMASAEDPGHYLISGLSISEAILLADPRQVLLNVGGLQLDQTYNLVILGVADDHGNTLLGQVVNIIMPDPLLFPLTINVGGTAVDGFLPDIEWESAVEYGYRDGAIVSVPETTVVENTNYPELYQYQRSGIVNYNLRVPDGSYIVELHFAEMFGQQPGSRVFDVIAEGILFLDNLDIVQTAGLNTAFTVDIPLTITDGMIEIYFSAETGNPILAGITVTIDGFLECDGGDLNHDGSLDVLDVVLIVDFILNGTADECDVQTGDMNFDGILDIIDIVLMIDAILNSDY